MLITIGSSQLCQKHDSEWAIIYVSKQKNTKGKSSLVNFLSHIALRSFIKYILENFNETLYFNNDYQIVLFSKLYFYGINAWAWNPVWLSGIVNKLSDGIQIRNIRKKRAEKKSTLSAHTIFHVVKS